MGACVGVEKNPLSVIFRTDNHDDSVDKYWRVNNVELYVRQIFVQKYKLKYRFKIFLKTLDSKNKWQKSMGKQSRVESQDSR